MRIKKTLSVSSVTMGALVVGFFGYMAYKNFLHDGAAAIAQQLTALIAGFPDDPQDYNAEQAGIKRAEIALAEYRKNVYEQPSGSNSGPEIDKYTGGNPTQWCTLFVSWVAKEAGTPVWFKGTNSWRVVNSRDFANILEETGTWYDREEVIEKGLEPRPGDFIVYWRGDFESRLGHVDIVVDTSDTKGLASTVGGNLNERVAYRENYPYLQNYGFLGFGRPEKG